MIVFLKNNFLFNDINLTFFSIGILITFLVALSAWHRIEKNKLSFYLILIFYVFSFGLVIISINWFLFMIGWELVTLTTTLILLWDKKSTAWKYFIVQFIGGSFLIYTVLLAFSNGYNHIGPIEEIWLQNMFIVAIGIKSLIFGFHFWMPIIYRKASTTFCAISSGWVAKLGYIILLKIIDNGNQLLLILGFLMVFYGGYRALRENNYKILLAFSTLSQLGFIAIAIGSGSKYGYYGAIIHIIAHGLAKSTLFNGATFWFEEYGTMLIEKFKSCSDRQWINTITTFFAFLSIMGIPLFIGYNSKYLIKHSLNQNIYFIIIINLASIITVLYSMKVLSLIFLNRGKIDIKKLTFKYKCKGNYVLSFIEKVSLLLGIVFLVIFGIFPNFIIDNDIEYHFLTGFFYSFIYILIALRFYFAKYLSF